MKDENDALRGLSDREIALEQLKYTKKQYRMSCLLTFFTVCILCVTVTASSMFYRRFNDIYKDLVVINANMKDITTDLADLDLKNVSERLMSTLDSSEKAMDTVSEAMSQIDVEELNRSIQNLQKALEPLVGLFGALGRR